MANGRTLWTLDTCGCKIIIEWDNQKALDEREMVYTFKSRCDRHNAANARPADVVEENREKNQGMAAVADAEGVPATALVWERNEDGFAIRKAPKRG